jgi:hypothetical protein
MLSLRNTAAMAHALSLLIDTDLMHLLQCRAGQLSEHTSDDLAELAHFIIVHAGDLMTQVEAAAGFSPSSTS